MKAYKVFDESFKCRGFQYEVGKTYKLDGIPVLCSRGFHACQKVSDCFAYYSFDPKNKVAEVELTGTILGIDDDKQCANEITIVRELTWNEMLDLANTGKGNSGYRNSGYSNSGNRNSGDRNSGYSNSGDSNSGDRNSGNRNSGNRNSGYSNSGDRNSGYSNSGDSNSGDSNSGDSNSGNRNSGYSNSGNSNSGNRNSGNSNSGDFNTTTPEIINCFNKPCNRKLWESAEKPDFIYFDLTKWISFEDMSDQEKIQYPKAYVCNGYLKTFEYKEAWANSFAFASTDDIKLLKELPNFDADVFEEITGIKIV